jgi:hypothetical protein
LKQSNRFFGVLARYRISVSVLQIEHQPGAREFARKTLAHVDFSIGLELNPWSRVSVLKFEIRTPENPFKNDPVN